MSKRCRSESVDEFDEYLGSSLRDPGFRAAYDDAEERSRLLACLVRLRKSLRLTQVEVARRMQTTQSSISEFEGGATDPLLSTLQRYARAVTARVRVKIEMPTDGPWLPANQGAYVRSTVRTMPSVQSVAPSDPRESIWRSHATTEHDNRINRFELRVNYDR
jgi:transcriptional regulator with XRE-family HTH domain